MSDHHTNERSGYSGFSLLAWFAGGMLAGAAAAYLADPANRTRVGKLVVRTRERAARLPKALGEASNAAQEAFAETYRANGTL